MTRSRTAGCLVASGISLLAIGVLIGIGMILLVNVIDNHDSSFFAPVPHRGTVHLDRGTYTVFFTDHGSLTKWSGDEVRGMALVSLAGPDGSPVPLRSRELVVSTGGFVKVDVFEFRIESPGTHDVRIQAAPGQENNASTVEVSFSPQMATGWVYWAGFGATAAILFLGVSLLGIGRWWSRRQAEATALPR